jgi:hypothetical protein
MSIQPRDTPILNSLQGAISLAFEGLTGLGGEAGRLIEWMAWRMSGKRTPR